MVSFVSGLTPPLRQQWVLPLKCTSQPRRPLVRACVQSFDSSLAPNDSNPRPTSQLDEINKSTGEADEHIESEALAEREEPDDSDNDNDHDEENGGWFDILERIGKKDTYVMKPSTSSGVMNLAELDSLGREALASASYDTVVDVDIEEGGLLSDDEDNNDLFCGVGLDALVDTPQLVENMRNELNIETATHVQLATVPRIADGKDIVIQSHTGTGKTLAFLLPMLENTEPELNRVQGIVIAPTRELAMQIFREVEKLIKGLDVFAMALIGGANPTRQVEKLRKQTPHIVVGTPGRLAELHEQKELRLNNARVMIVDEVDQSIGEAFVQDVAYLLHHCPRKVQKVLVSATSDVDAVRAFATRYLHKPILLRVGGMQRLPKQIEHWYCVVPARMRIELLRKLMNTDPPPRRAIAFVDEPRRVDMVAEKLYEMKIPSGTLRGNAHKTERAEVLAAFRKGQIPLLITTEVAARGLDIPEVTHVFNIDLPTDGDHYIHRAGRCGRVRNAGTVVSFTTAETAFVIGKLEKETGVHMRRMEPRGGKYVEVISRSEVGRGTVAATRGSKPTLTRTKYGPKAGKVVASQREQRGAKADSADGKQEKVRIKRRQRDIKNKGKPKGRLGRGKDEPHNLPGMARKEKDDKKELKHVDVAHEKERVDPVVGEFRQSRNLSERARREGWVGNR